MAYNPTTKPGYSKHTAANVAQRQVENMVKIDETGTEPTSPNRTRYQNASKLVAHQRRFVQAEEITSTNKLPNKPTTEEELKWYLRNAHMFPNTDWLKVIEELGDNLQSFKPLDFVHKHLPELPLSIQEKLRILSQFKKIEKRMSKKFSRRKTIKRTSERFSQKIQRKTVNSLGFSTSGFSLLEPWGDTIGRITANFGTNVASYFNFIRFLVYINAMIAIVMFLFVSLPQVISGHVWTNDVKSGFFGLFSNTIFYFGAYSNSILGDSPQYIIPLAYLITWCCANFFTIVIIIVSMFYNYRRIKLYNLGINSHYSTQLFVCWDHSVTKRKAVNKMKGLIVNYFRETIHEENFNKGLSFTQRISLLIIRIVCNLVSVAALGGSAYVIYYLASHTIKPGLQIPRAVDDFFEKYQLPLLVSGLKVAVPPLLSLLLFAERYHPRTEIKIKISRTAVFYVASLIVFLASVYSLSNTCMNDIPTSDIYTTTTQNPRPGTVHSSDVPSNHSELSLNSNDTYCCWENEVGEQLFQMVILDLIICILVNLVFLGGQYVLYRCGKIKLGKPDFAVAGFIMELVYGQSLIWLGLYTAPFLAGVAVVKLIVVFYFNYAMVRLFCEPNNIFRASRSGTFYLFILLATLFVCLFPVAYAIVKLKPSGSCGPFKTNHRVYEVLTNEIGTSPVWLQDIIHFASTAAVIVPTLLFLTLLVIYYKVRAEILHSQNKELRHTLEFELKVINRKFINNMTNVQGLSVSSGLDQMSQSISPINAMDKPGSNVLGQKGRSTSPGNSLDKLNSEVASGIQPAPQSNMDEVRFAPRDITETKAPPVAAAVKLVPVLPHPDPINLPSSSRSLEISNSTPTAAPLVQTLPSQEIGLTITRDTGVPEEKIAATLTSQQSQEKIQTFVGDTDVIDDQIWGFPINPSAPEDVEVVFPQRALEIINAIPTVPLELAMQSPQLMSSLDIVSDVKDNSFEESDTDYHDWPEDMNDISFKLPNSY